MTEKDMQMRVGKYFTANPPTQPEAYELKFVNTEHSKSLRFDALPEHQRKALLLAEEGGLYHRITDQPWIKGRPAYTHKKPFDCFVLNNVKAYVTIWFYKPRQEKIFYMVRIKEFLQLEKDADRKSATEEMIKSVSERIINYSDKKYGEVPLT